METEIPIGKTSTVGMLDLNPFLTGDFGILGVKAMLVQSPRDISAYT